MGRPPHPAGLRALRNQRERPRHHDKVPDAETPDALPPSDASIAPPRHLTPDERAIWRYFAPLLAGAKMLTPADVETLATYCVATALVKSTKRRLNAAWRKRKYDVHLIKMLDAQLRGWAEKQTSLAVQLGLTAISRTKTAWSGHGQVIDPVKRPQSKIAELQAEARTLRRPVAVAKPDAKKEQP